MRERATEQEQDRLGVGLFGVLAIAHALGRWWFAHVPGDFGAYLAAAQAYWVEGWSPYDVTALEQLEIYQGYPFIYLPGSLPVLWPVAVIGPTATLALDAILRVLVLGWCARWLTRRFELPIEWPQLGLMLLVFGPVGETFLHGNVALYFFGLFGVTEIAARRGVGGARGLALGLGLGLLLMVKPMWGIPCAFVAIAHWRAGLTAGLALGACVVGGASLAQPESMAQWREILNAVADQWQAFDLGYFGMWARIVGGLTWGAFGLWIIARRRDHPHAWMWACTSLLVWPRISTYSYALMLPLLCALWVRSGWKVALVATLPAFGMIPWIVGSADGLFRLTMYYVWAAALSAWLAYTIVRDDSGRSDPESLSLVGDPSTDRAHEHEATS